jgi:hypothetical protein
VGNTHGLFSSVGDKIGSTFTDKNFVATSANPVIASQYGIDNDENAIIHTHVPAGMSAFRGGTDVYGSAQNRESQKEYLLSPDTQFQVTGDQLDDTGTRHVYLKVTGQPRLVSR